MATKVMCRWAGAIFEATRPFLGQRNKIIKKSKIGSDRPTDQQTDQQTDQLTDRRMDGLTKGVVESCMLIKRN